jgi:hypothetical protein
MSKALAAFFQDFQCLEYDAPLSSSTHRSAASSKALSISAFQIKIVPDNAASSLARTTYDRRWNSTPIWSGSESPRSPRSWEEQTRSKSLDMSNIRKASRWGNGDIKLAEAAVVRKSLVPPTRHISVDDKKSKHRDRIAAPSKSIARGSDTARTRRNRKSEPFLSQQRIPF